MSRERASGPRFTVLRAAIMALALALLAWPLTVAAGVAAAAVAAMLGVVAGNRVAGSRLRSPSALGLAALAAAAGLWLARLPVRSTAVADLLGPLAAFEASEVLRWLVLVLPAVLALRMLAERRPAMAVFEVVAVSLAVAASVAAHRDGSVHRPLPIGDWAWSRGIDPGMVLLALGGLASLLLAALLIAERRWRRLPAHFAALVAIALALLFLIRTVGPPAPKAAGDLGLTGDPAQEEEEDEGGGGRPDQGGEGDRRRDGSQLGDLQFRNEYRSSGNEAPVAVVVFHDDYEPPTGVFYFRQSAFSQYNGRRLVQATRADVDRDIVARFPSETLAVPGAPAIGPGRMPLPLSVGLLADHVRPFALDAPAELRPIQNPNPARFRRAFGARSHVPTLPLEELLGRRPGDPAWDQEQWRHYTEAPRDSRYRQLAERLTARLRPAYRDDPMAQALVIKEYLDTSGIYSRKSRHADAGDPTGSFLFGDLTGYCVHFAHAATYLFRTLGLPTRVAAGYALPADSRAGGSALMIRGQNAHAWPEVYLEGAGWVVVDPAPQQSLDDPTTDPDQALQRMLGEMMRIQPDSPPRDETLAERLRLALIGKLLLLLVLAAVLFAYLVKVYRQLAPHLLPPRTLDRVGYRAALDRLAEVGVRRRFGESREGFARRSLRLAPSFAELSGWHLGWALGSRQSAERRRLRELLARVRLEIDRATPAWRRLLGTLNPISWLRAR